MTISRWIILRMKNVLNKICRENKSAHFTFNTFFSKRCHLWDNVEKYGGVRRSRHDVTIWRIRFSCWISKAACAHAPWHTHALASAHIHKYAVFIAFPQQKLLRERASLLRYTYTVSVVNFCLFHVSWSSFNFIFSVLYCFRTVGFRVNSYPITKNSAVRVSDLGRFPRSQRIILNAAYRSTFSLHSNLRSF
jgi:hypothetical protein